MSLANDGFSIGFKIMLDNDIQQYTEPKYLFHSYGTDDSNIVFYVQEGKICCYVTLNRKLWAVSILF